MAASGPSSGGMETELRENKAIEDDDKGQDQFTWQIFLFALGEMVFKTTQNPNSHLYAVILDTQATGNNWISSELVAKLGMESKINRSNASSNTYGFTGERILSEGTIAFQWMLHDGKTVHEPATFHVSPSSLGIDMVFGAPYIVEKKLLSSNRDRMLPLIEHRRVKLSEKAKEALLKEEQRQEKSQVEAENQIRQPRTREPLNIQVPSLSIRLQRSFTFPQIC